MIGTAYCGQFGEAVEAEGNLFEIVTCVNCKKGRPDTRRFPHMPFAFVFVSKTAVHAGVLRTYLDQTRGLKDVLAVATAAMADPADVEAIYSIVEVEVAGLEDIVERDRLAAIAAEEAALLKVQEEAAEEARLASIAAKEAQAAEEVEEG